ncbi:hypothetical protein DFH07DRAFT_589990 [Mycena maculata]|uniref:Uncharacterized protein n=1 Tax=Mycena maculata TaxID=230809 RepID=A0AAD7IPZ1_9AGAR|nr:hypothetical protein DFH07DRAFT_589990 [Mycena maculata]
MDQSCRQSGLFDLTALEKLSIHCIDPANYIADIFDYSPPLGLKSLTLGDPVRSSDEPCSIAVIDKLLRFGAECLEELVLDPAFGGQQLPALEMIQHAETPIKAWPTAPHLTEVTFRIIFGTETALDVHQDLESFDDIMQAAFTLNVVEDLLSRKFPRFQRLIFHFTAPDLCEFHFDRTLRNQLEETVREKVSPVGQCRLSFQWFEYGLESDGLLPTTRRTAFHYSFN